MKNILVCVDSFEVGGVTEVVKSIYRGIDQTKFNMDFVAVRKLDTEFEEEIIKNGNMIYYLEIPALLQVPILNYTFQQRSFFNLVRKNISKKYDVAHIHAHADLFVYAAKKIGIPNIIIHAHEAVSDFSGNENKSKAIHFVYQKMIRMYRKYATVLGGDSAQACVAKYGAELINDKRTELLYPPVNSERFDFKKYSRDNAIKEYDIDSNSLNLVNVGRLSPVKNQKFIIDIIKELKRKVSCNLYIIGDGPLSVELPQYAVQMGVSDLVHFLPPDTSPLIYSAMNFSIIPSLSEAFGMVAVESQLMRVPCFASKNLPLDVDIGICKFIDLSEGAAFWAEEIYKCYVNDSKDVNIDFDRFSVEKLVNKVTELYMK